jgi:hypothetical protein
MVVVSLASSALGAAATDDCACVICARAAKAAAAATAKGRTERNCRKDMAVDGEITVTFWIVFIADLSVIDFNNLGATLFDLWTSVLPHRFSHQGSAPLNP